jgi:hypothetical protein
MPLMRTETGVSQGLRWGGTYVNEQLVCVTVAPQRDTAEPLQPISESDGRYLTVSQFHRRNPPQTLGTHQAHIFAVVLAERSLL